ncbi:MAG: ABC transporter permease [Chloroflexi bacterium]|nr:ABC transporter permease [Chloroflexota bacterium]
MSDERAAAGPDPGQQDVPPPRDADDTLLGEEHAQPTVRRVPTTTRQIASGSAPLRLLRPGVAAPDEGVDAARTRVVAPRGYVATTLHRFRQDRVSMAALGLLAAIVLLTAAGPWLAQATLGLDPYRQTLPRRYQPPSAANPFGTDDLGRDALARTLVAGRVSFSIGTTIALVSLLVGVPIGLASGYYGGRFDDVSNAVIQTLANIPAMFLLILLAATLRPGPVILAVIIGLLGWMGTARLVRGMALSVREREYVHAATVLGASDGRVIFRHLLPNVFSVITVIAGFDVAGGILAESGLSYLGLGVQPPTASWGSMLAASLENVSRAPWLVLFPGLAIFLTTLAIFLLADGLRDALDPRLRS